MVQTDYSNVLIVGKPVTVTCSVHSTNLTELQLIIKGSSTRTLATYKASNDHIEVSDWVKSSAGRVSKMINGSLYRLSVTFDAFDDTINSEEDEWKCVAAAADDRLVASRNLNHIPSFGK